MSARVTRSGRNCANKGAVQQAIGAPSGSSGPTAQRQGHPIRMPPSFRIKYTKFKGDGSQDVDDWME